MKTKFFLKTIIAALFFPVLLFAIAGTLDFFQGWIFLLTTLLTALMNYATIRNDPALMTERSQAGPGAKSWDKIILGLSGMTYLCAIAVAGLDSGKHHWSPDFHWTLYALAIILTILGHVIFLTARKENKYFSSVVRIQKDRNHQVCDTGIYQVVRHPGYAGMMLSLAAFPLLTGSVWSGIPVMVSIILLLIRTELEDRTLQSELNGYIQYTQKSRYKIIPYIW
ncbi:MAG: isoprenylcysteine carboxylmethyltransferase family protein [Saprospiraceae bacterium]